MYLVLNDKLLSAEGSESRGIDCDATTIQGWMDCINAFMSYFAPYNFFKWNILRNFSSKFGVNAWHWNFTQVVLYLFKKQYDWLIYLSYDLYLGLSRHAWGPSDLCLFCCLQITRHQEQWNLWQDVVHC
jgi:hypothetical protein